MLVSRNFSFNNNKINQFDIKNLVKLQKNGIIFDLVLSQKQLVFKANWSYISRACFLPIDIAIRALCDLASSLEDSASMILVFATSKGVVRAPPMLPEMV